MTEAAQCSMRQLVEASECGGGGSDLWSEWVLPRFLFLHLPLRLLSQLVLHVPTTMPMLEPPCHPPTHSLHYITATTATLPLCTTLCCQTSRRSASCSTVLRRNVGNACVCKKKRCVIPYGLCTATARCESNALLHQVCLLRYGMQRWAQSYLLRTKGTAAKRPLVEEYEQLHSRTHCGVSGKPTFTCVAPN